MVVRLFVFRDRFIDPSLLALISHPNRFLAGTGWKRRYLMEVLVESMDGSGRC
jgi:hypothetical protein